MINCTLGNLGTGHASAGVFEGASAERLGAALLGSPRFNHLHLRVDRQISRVGCHPSVELLCMEDPHGRRAAIQRLGHQENRLMVLWKIHDGKRCYHSYLERGRKYERITGAGPEALGLF